MLTVSAATEERSKASFLYHTRLPHCLEYVVQTEMHEKHLLFRVRKCLVYISSLMIHIIKISGISRTFPQFFLGNLVHLKPPLLSI